MQTAREKRWSVGRWEGLSREACFYGGAFPPASIAKDTKMSGDFLPEQFVVEVNLLPLFVSSDGDLSSEELEKEKVAL